jgi:uncharacterized protein YndB with AHSA1/START domain
MSQARSGALTVSTPSDLEIAMTRVFEAPRQKVFDAWTKPELLRQWFGRRGDILKVCEVDLRVGGSYRFVWHLREGGEMGMGGEYREIDAPVRLVSTEVFDDYAEMGAAVNTMVLEEREGKTILAITSRYDSKEARDAVIESGMEGGANESFDRLAGLLAGLA